MAEGEQNIFYMVSLAWDTLSNTITLSWRIELTFSVSTISTGLAALSVAFAALTYWRNSNTKRAEFLLQLHQAFFVDPTYKPIRGLLDNSNESAAEALRLHIQEETAELTDFLNFFELVAYFECSNKLRPKDVRALLGYYLHLVKVNGHLSAYIGKEQTSFEYLNKAIK